MPPMLVSTPAIRREVIEAEVLQFFVEFEQVRLGLPDDLPLICAQWQSIIAVNYPARKYGIKRYVGFRLL